MPELANAARRVTKSTYVPLNVPTQTDTPGRAIQKYGFVTQLALQPGEVAAARAGAEVSPATARNEGFWQALTALEGTPLPAQRPASNAFATISAADLTIFGKTIAAHRQQPLSAAGAAPPRAAFGAPAATVAQPDLPLHCCALTSPWWHWRTSRKPVSAHRLAC